MPASIKIQSILQNMEIQIPCPTVIGLQAVLDKGFSLGHWSCGFSAKGLQAHVKPFALQAAMFGPLDALNAMQPPLGANAAGVLA